MSETLSMESLDSMTIKDLREVAKANEIKIPAGSTKDDIVDLLLDHDGELVMPDAPDAIEGELVAEKADEFGRDRRKYKLTLNSDDKAGGDAPLPVGVNGYVWTIPRDMEVEVPESVIDVLKDAKMTIMEKAGEDDEGRPIYKERDVRRFSFSAVPVD